MGQNPPLPPTKKRERTVSVTAGIQCCFVGEMASTGLRKRCWIAGVTWKGDICGTHSEESGVIGEDAGVGLRVFLLSRGVTLAWCLSAMVVPFGHGGAFRPWWCRSAMVVQRSARGVKSRKAGGTSNSCASMRSSVSGHSIEGGVCSIGGWLLREELRQLWATGIAYKGPSLMTRAIQCSERWYTPVATRV